MGTRASVTTHLFEYVRLVQHWKLKDVETPDGSRSPVVLRSQDGEARVVLIELKPNERLGEHQVKEAALLLVVDGRVHVESGGLSVRAGVGELFWFDPDERRLVESDGGARILLMLAPWPGVGHYRGEERARATAS
jgi:quercetin dioxygenase-like cupin family protein